MRIITRGDMDGLASSVLLTTVENIREIAFVHPKDAQDGLINATKDDILVNLPYIKGCGMWFDHHISEEEKAQKARKVRDFKGLYKIAPSAARVVYDFYKSPKFAPYKKMLEAIDRFDSGQLTLDDVNNPKDWILLAYTMDPRTGLGPEFQKYFRWMVEYVKELPIEKVLEHSEVKKRIERVRKEQGDFKKLLEKCCSIDGNVIITDLRIFSEIPTGNRFLVYTLFPKANVEVRIFRGKGNKKIIIACGHSIFNRTCKVNLGKMLAGYGGGGHAGAGTCQISADKADSVVKEIIAKLKENK
jgi:oligoribonuclease NrnB/cAMP/cGMP phosphodiesterase (DHH superfamily)